MAAPITAEPWRELPPEAATALGPQLPAVADEIIAAISHGVPEYALPLEGAFGRGLRTGVQVALSRFLDLFGAEGAEPDTRREVYVQLGRGELRAGRPLEALLAAYRLGARVAWRRLAEAGERAGLEPQVLYLLAEAIFAYIDEISAESVDGFAMEQAAAAGEAQRRRRRLARLLIEDPPVDAASIEAAAVQAAWPLPDVVAAVYAETAEPDTLARLLGQDVIATQLDPGSCAVVPDPDAPGRRAQIDRALTDLPAALGPSGSWRAAALSAGRARSALTLGEAGALGTVAGELVVADDHRLSLLLAADPQLAGDLADARLAALESETPASRARLTATLAAWLDQDGRTEQVARVLGVHPQTVRYRMGRLRELLGGALEDPTARLELSVALRAQAVRDNVRP